MTKRTLADLDGEMQCATARMARCYALASMLEEEACSLLAALPAAQWPPSLRQSLEEVMTFVNTTKDLSQRDLVNCLAAVSRTERNLAWPDMAREARNPHTIER